MTTESRISPVDAEEFTQTLEASGKTFWRQILLAKKMGIPQALGLELKEWISERIGGTIKLSIEDRLEAIKEIKAEYPKMSQREIGTVLGVHKSLIGKDLKRANDQISPASDDEGPEKVENSTYEDELEENPVREMEDQLRAEIELVQETDHGIINKEVQKRILSGWQRITKDQNQRACHYLALNMVKFLFGQYPDLQDKL